MGVGWCSREEISMSSKVLKSSKSFASSGKNATSSGRGGSGADGYAPVGRGGGGKGKQPNPGPEEEDVEKPTPHIMALKEMRIWMLGGIREVTQPLSPSPPHMAYAHISYPSYDEGSINKFV